MKKIKEIIERIKYNASADAGNILSAKKLNIYNKRVKDVV